MNIDTRKLIVVGKVAIASYAVAILSLFVLPETILGVRKLALVELAAGAIFIISLITYAAIRNNANKRPTGTQTQSICVPWAFGCGVLSLVLVTTMLTHYQRIDATYLIYGLSSIGVISGVAACIARRVFKERTVAASLLSVFLAILISVGFVFLRTQLR